MTKNKTINKPTSKPSREAMDAVRTMIMGW